MEVHHHPHVEKKGFKEYFLEFLMIFLAVTMGFIAENIREHFSDRTKEKKYVQSLYYDLKDDTVNLNNNISFWRKQIKNIDTLRIEIKKGDYMNVRLANTLAPSIRGYDNFLYHDRTIAQLKSTGNFRLLNTALADSMIEYDSYITSQLRDQETHGQKLYIEVNNLQNRIFDTGIWDIYMKNGPVANLLFDFEYLFYLVILVFLISVYYITVGRKQYLTLTENKSEHQKTMALP